MRCASSSLFFDARTLCQQLNNGFVLNAGQHRKANISFFLLFLLKYSVLTHFPGPSVVYIVSLIHWMFCFWESSSLLPGRIGKIMVYFVLASENWNLSDKERVKKAHWLCFRLGVFWCLNPRTYNEGWLPPLLTWEDQRLSTEGKIVWKSPPPPPPPLNQGEGVGVNFTSDG